MAEVDSLEIRISASSEQAATSISKLVSSLNELKTALKGGVGNKQFQGLCDSLRQLGDTAKEVDGSIGALAKAANAIERLSSIGKVRIPKSLNDGIRNVGLAAEMVTPQAVQNLDNMTRSLQRLSNVDLKGVASAMRSVRSNTAEAAGKVGAAQYNPKSASPFGALFGRGMIQNAFKFNVDSSTLKHAKDVADALWSRLKSLGQKIKLRIEASTIGRVKESLGQIQTIMKSLGRIAFYRAIRSVIKAITKAFQEGLQNAYAFSAGLSNAIDGRIATALDGLASSASTMKNQLGAAFGSLLTAIAPIINTLISLITALANAITQLFAAFSGGTFLKAKDTTAKFADDMKKGGGAAKEWKNQLMGFDEINRLEDQSGGGGGGGSSGLSAADMFEVQKIDQAIKDFVDAFKAAVLAGDWQGVGNLLGGKVNEIFARIDWAGIGRKIGYAMNGVIQSLYYTLKTIDFIAIGKDIATLINKAIESIDFGVWGRLLVRKITAAFDFLIGFIGELDFYALGVAVHDFIVGAFNEATEWLGSYDWSEVGTKAKENIIAFFDGLQVADVAISISNFLERACNAVKDFFTGFGLKEVVDKMVDTLKEFWDNLSPTGKWVLGAILGIGAVSTAFSLAATAAKTFSTVIGALPFLKVLAGIALLVVGILKVKDGLDKWTEAGELTSGALWDIVEGVGFVAIAIGMFTSPILLFSGIVAVVAAEIVKHWDDIKSWWETSKLHETIQTVLDNIQTRWDTFTSAMETGCDNICNWFAGMAEKWDEVKTGIALKIEEAKLKFRELKSTISQQITNIKQYFADLKAKWDEKIEPLHDALDNFKSSWSKAFGGIAIAVQNAMGWLGRLISKIKEAIGWLINLFSLAGGGQYNDPSYDVYNDSSAWLPFASGGFPDEGQIFLAREAGPELVGTIGGRTAVANNDQIIAGIREGVFEAVTAAMGGNNGGGQPITIYLDGREIARSTTKYQTQMARAGAY